MDSGAITAEWLAGFFDGEGNLTPDRRWIRVQITQKDRDVLDRISAFLGGAGRVYPLERHGHRWHVLQIRKVSEVKRFAAVVGPHLILKRERLAAEIARIS